MSVSLETAGDIVEREHWSKVNRYFPLYEPFWLRHAYSLRGHDGQIRADVDRRLQLMAQENYLCFKAVAEARGAGEPTSRIDWSPHAAVRTGRIEFASLSHRAKAPPHTYSTRRQGWPRKKRVRYTGR